MKKSSTYNLTLTAMFLALGLVLPFLTGQIPQFGNMLLPMHFPVFLCALICGWQYGAVIGFVLPILRGILFGMPVFFPSGLAMAFELLTYGLVCGLVYKKLNHYSTNNVYISLICAMFSGRCVWGIVQMILLGIGTDGFTFSVFIGSGFINAFPGIILQLILIPFVMRMIHKNDVAPTE